MIRIKLQHTYLGPNLFAARPVIVVAMDILPEMVAAAPAQIARLNKLFASWFQWKPSKPELDAGEIARFLTLLAQAALCEVRGAKPVARALAVKEHFLIILGYHDADLSFSALERMARLLVVAEATDEQIQARMDELWQMCRARHPHSQSQLLIEYCQKQGIPYRSFFGETNNWQFGDGERSVIFRLSSPISDNFAWSTNKEVSKEVFRVLGAPVSPSVLVEQEAGLEEAVRQIGYPCVLKPLDQAMGKGVTLDINDMKLLREGYAEARRFSAGPLMVERQVPGEIHRLFVVRGRLWMAIIRPRPEMVGDGRSAILQLVEKWNAPIIAQMRPGSTKKPVPLDEDFIAVLREQGFAPEDVLAEGKTVIACRDPSSAKGADCIDVSAIIHPDTKLMAETLAMNFSIAVCGIDYITTDITKSCFDAGAFLEININPGLKTPQYAGASKDEVGQMVLGPVPGRIPSVLVVCSPSQLEAVRKQLPLSPETGWLAGERFGIGVTEFPREDTPPQAKLDKILKNQTVTSVVALCDMEKVMTFGMPLSRPQLTVIYQDVEMSDPWRQALAEHSGRVVQAKTPAALVELLNTELQ